MLIKVVYSLSLKSKIPNHGACMYLIKFILTTQITCGEIVVIHANCIQ